MCENNDHLFNRGWWINLRYMKNLLNRDRCDVSKPVEFEQLWSKAESALGKISILINNAGFYSDDVKKCLDVMLYGVSLGVNLALDKMNINNVHI